MPLRQLADIVPSSGCYQVRHEGARRVQTDARHDLLINTLITAVGIILLLSALTRN